LRFDEVTIADGQDMHRLGGFTGCNHCGAIQHL
jgi:hypothetical protein